MEVIGYSNYLIYPDGKVYNEKFKRYLKMRYNKGYHRVVLYNNNKSKSLQVHRLVALHYIHNPDNKPMVDHINRDKIDNRLENLRWVTSSENGQNTDKYITNTIGHKNITYHKRDKRYQYFKTINKVSHTKYFKTLEEAIEYKKEYEKDLFT